MGILMKSYKNGCKNWISTWFIIYLSLIESFWSVRGEETTYSSGLEETTTYTEAGTTSITITPILTTEVITTQAPTCQSQPEFIPWGTDNGDSVFPNGDDNFILHCPSIDVPIDSQNMGCFYLATNGYITNGNTLPFTPTPLEVDPNNVVLMPMWADIDTRFVGNIYYQIADYYEEPTPAQTPINLNAIKALFAKFGATGFDPVWALKVTWEKVVPYNERDADEELTFQFILATNGSATRMAYLYDQCQFTWNGDNLAVMGYAYPGFSYYHRNNLTPDIFLLGEEGNTADLAKGVFIFELSTQYTVNHPQQCLEWARVNTVPPSDIIDNPVFYCPCTAEQASNDWLFALGQYGCYYLIFPEFGYSKVCCYTEDEGLTTQPLVRNNIQLYSAILSPEEWRINDYEPYVHCCSESDYCSIYNTYRPNGICASYILPLLRFLYGDPHIETLDGYTYTFNGLGEFVLLNVYNATNTNEKLMEIQCRTKVVGDTFKATAFSAFVIRSENVDIQVSTRDEQNALKIFANSQELTSFYTISDYVWTKSPFRLSLQQGQFNSLLITHKSQTSMSITIKNNILHLGLKLGYAQGVVKTNGLLGTYNNNTSDDLETPKGTFLSTNSTEEQIYYNFGMLWKVNNSIFYYESGETSTTSQTNFVPSFLKINQSSTDYQNAVTVCTANQVDCIYDYIVTGNKALAQNTQEVEKTIAYQKVLAGIKPPVFNGSDTMTVFVNQKYVHIVNVESASNNLTLGVVKRQNCNVTLSQKQVQISVNITKPEPVIASFQVSDEYNYSTALFNLTAMICPNCYNGNCNTSVVHPSRQYEYVCTCDQGWRGETCNMDARCEPLNCTCSGPNDNYTCDCPPGYIFTQKCQDINECLSPSTNNCSQLCTNTIGSYKCSCNTGYQLVNQTECVNLNECELYPQNCEQICTDTDGSFNCSCFPGYKVNGSKCVLETDLCTNVTKCAKANGCTVINSVVTCICNRGYEFNVGKLQCEDINECVNVTCINGTCVNSAGSYACTCDIGSKLANDGRTCEACGHNKWGKNCANTCSGANCITCDKKTGCICKAGFKGTTCAEDINECDNPNYCNNTISTCRNGIGSASCTCKTGFQLNQKGTCIDINECTVSNDCSTHATCTNNFGSHTCTCNKGFQGDGKNCTDVDECSMEHPCTHTCINQIGSFSCICNSNYKLQDDRITCKEEAVESDDGRLYIIIFGSIAGAILVGLLLTLWIYCFGCCACCPCACIRRRRRHRYFSTLEDDRLNIRSAFGTVSSSLRGKLVREETFPYDPTRPNRYLEDWADFSPYSDNNRQDIGHDNRAWDTFGEDSSNWGNIFNQIENSREFRIERPKFRP